MEFQAHHNHLKRMLHYIHERGIALGCDEALIHRMELAAEEALVNIICYAYPKEKGRISLACEKTKTRLVVVIRDQGVPFNPIDAEIDPQLETPVEEREVGGLGIFLIRKVIDEATYRREKEENILHLVILDL